MNTNNRMPQPPDDHSLLRASGVTEPAIAQGTLSTHTNAAQTVMLLEEQRRGWISRLFTEKALVKELQERKIRTVRDYSEYQRNLFRLATDTKLEMAHSMCLAMTRELKVGNQERFTTMVLEKAESLRRTVLAKQDGFLGDMDGAYTRLEQYAHRPQLMERALGSLARQEEQFFTWIDGLLEDFLSISKQRLDEYRKAENETKRPVLGQGDPGMWSA